MVREVPVLTGVPPSPTSLRNLRRRHDPGEVVRVPPLNAMAVLLIEFYQRRTAGRPHVCNHYPSCSEYARLAYLQYGPFAATFLMLERLRECSDSFSEWPRENRP